MASRWGAAIVLTLTVGASFAAGDRGVFAGTATFACDVDDGGASRLELTSADARMSVFVHGVVPDRLRGSLPIRIGAATASAGLVFCGRRATACVTASDGSLVVSRNTGKTIAGRVRFVADGEAWREARFDIRIVEPPRPTVCG